MKRIKFKLTGETKLWFGGALSRRLLGGIAYTRADDAERIEARIGWRF